MRRTSLSSYLPAFLCALGLALCIALTHPVLEMAINDDWSYVWSARVLADTGHVVYNGWSTAILGWQLYWGALFIKLFGFSFLTLRISMLVLAMATVALLQRLFVRFGISERNSVFATLTLGLSPVFLPLAFSFMSDIPGFLCLLICLYGCVRAIQSETDAQALRWIVFAGLSNALGGTVRQIAWLGVLVLVPSTAWLIRRRRGALITGAAVWVASCLFIVVCMHWFSLQPYSLPEKVFAKVYDKEGLVEAGSSVIRNLLEIFLFALPVLVGFIVKFPVRVASVRRAGLGAAGLLIAGTAVLLIRHKPVYWLAPFSSNYVTAKGLVDILQLLGERPYVLSPSLRAVLTFLTFAGLFASLLCFWNASRLPDLPNDDAFRTVSTRDVFVLLGPFTVAYGLLLVTRGTIYDRYLLPLEFILLLASMRLYERKFARRLPLLSGLVLGLFTAFGVAAMHDLYTSDRARQQAADELRAAGVSRSDIRAGFEYDAWTQLENTGFINEKRLRIPANAYHPFTHPLAECHFPYESLVPSVRGLYQLSYGPTSCLKDSGFPSVPYDTWMPPHSQAIYIRKMP